MISYIKFFKDGHVQTFIVNENFLDSGEATHEFSSPADATAHSTNDTFVVWDGEPGGMGIVEE